MNTPKQSTYKAHRVFCLTVLLLAMSLPFPVFALDLQEAKSQLLVGESVTGYVGIVKDAAGVAALVNDINAKRKASYASIAKRNQTSLNAVERLAAKKAIEKTAVGQMVQLAPGGAWVKK
ncbi:MAG: hypothetical protein COC05_05305 [Gammaproteobacteria bacterium]|nr:MAG: hypothetical protein COC05_05305 [Gammaproteobacteria bacterium]